MQKVFHLSKENPSGDDLSKLKEMTMVLLETLRLYGPAVFMQRKTTTDTVVGEIKIHRGFGIIIPFAIMHRDKKIWGDDADEFYSLRFQNGVTKAAKVPHALLAFSVGPRSCMHRSELCNDGSQPKFGLPVVLKMLDACA
ncbi:unnamed protein product [Urochloa humidicola]